MINLIPGEEKKRMSKSFYYRLTILSLIMLSFSILIASVAMLPAYFVSMAKEDLANKKLQIQKNELTPVPDSATLSAVEDLKNKIIFIESRQNSNFSLVERVLNSIILKKINLIKINEIRYEKNDQLGSEDAERITVGGTASSREVLLVFRKSLEDDIMFKQVNLPISSFVKGSNIKFFLSLIPRAPIHKK